MLRVVGFEDLDFIKLIIGVVNVYSIIIFCNMGINDLVMWVVNGVKEVGGMF